MQPHILYLQIWCYFKAETCSYLLCESHEFRFKVVGDMSICFWKFKDGGGGGSGLYKVYGEHCIILVKLEWFYVTSLNTQCFGVILKFKYLGIKFTQISKQLHLFRLQFLQYL